MTDVGEVTHKFMKNFTEHKNRTMRNHRDRKNRDIKIFPGIQHTAIPMKNRKTVKVSVAACLVARRKKKTNNNKTKQNKGN